MDDTAYVYVTKNKSVFAATSATLYLKNNSEC